MEKTKKCTISFDNTDAKSGSFLFEGETHTMGNALRQTIIANPKVDFCKYFKIDNLYSEHEEKTVLQLAFEIENENIISAMNQGLDDFSQWCQNLKDEFERAFPTEE